MVINYVLYYIFWYYLIIPQPISPNYTDFQNICQIIHIDIIFILKKEGEQINKNK